jgi:phospholipase C
MNEETQPSQGFTRRRLFGAAAVAGGAAVAATALPPNVQKALAAPLPGKRPSLSDIKHVVLLMQENRSFDH